MNVVLSEIMGYSLKDMRVHFDLVLILFVIFSERTLLTFDFITEHYGIIKTFHHLGH